MMKRSQREAWVVAGQVEPRGRPVFGFGEAEVANAAVAAYYATLAHASGDRGMVLEQLQEEFRAGLVELGS